MDKKNIKKNFPNAINIFKIGDYSDQFNLLDFLVYILDEYNLRAGELLSARWTDLYPDKYLIIRAKKNSRNVIIRDKIILNKIVNLVRTHKEYIFYPITYSKLYHHILTNHYHKFYTVKKRKNRKITHYFRYNNVSDIDNDVLIRDILNHNSGKSVKYYKNKMKGH